jgi:hypothetical protein
MTELSKSDKDVFFAKMVELRSEILEVAKGIGEELPMADAVIIIVDEGDSKDTVGIMLGSAETIAANIEHELEHSPSETMKILLNSVKKHALIPSAGLMRIILVTEGRVMCGRISLSCDPQC